MSAQNFMARTTAPQITARKGQEPIVCLTAYDAPTAAMLDDYCDLILVGDSVGMVVHGLSTTVGVTLEMMIMHGQAVMRGTSQACVIVDMPYGSYEDSAEQALTSARRIIKETGADGVKLEGGEAMAAHVKAITDDGIAVIGHVGLLPQTAGDNGGFRVKGRDQDAAAQIIRDAKAIEEAGAAAIVVEAVIEPVAAEVTKAVGVPIIGIGASRECDGQILVTEDMVGITGDHIPKFVKQYASVSADICLLYTSPSPRDS